jgi:acyl carrier protein
MTREEALARLKQILERDFEIPPHKVTLESSFMGTLGMDSLDVVDFVSYIEYAFDVDVGLQAYRDLDTVQKLLDFLIAHKKAAAR